MRIIEYDENVLVSIEKQALDYFNKHKELPILTLSRREGMHVKLAERNGRRLSVNGQFLMTTVLHESPLNDWTAYERGRDFVVLRR